MIPQVLSWRGASYKLFFNLFPLFLTMVELDTSSVCWVRDWVSTETPFWFLKARGLPCLRDEALCHLRRIFTRLEAGAKTCLENLEILRQRESHVVDARRGGAERSGVRGGPHISHYSVRNKPITFKRLAPSFVFFQFPQDGSGLSMQQYLPREKMVVRNHDRTSLPIALLMRQSYK